MNKKSGQDNAPPDFMGPHPEMKGKAEFFFKKGCRGHVKDPHEKPGPYDLGPEFELKGKGGDLLGAEDEKRVHKGQEGNDDAVVFVHRNQAVHACHAVDPRDACGQKQLYHQKKGRGHAHQLAASQEGFVETEFVFDGEGLISKGDGQGATEEQGEYHHTSGQNA